LGKDPKVSDVQATLHIDVERTFDEEYGVVYVASNDQIGLVTDGQTFEELLQNLQEAIAVCLEDTDTVTEFNLAPKPNIALQLRLPA
jgi:predicted RNase H-like HicB family nuclease